MERMKAMQAALVMKNLSCFCSKIHINVNNNKPINFLSQIFANTLITSQHHKHLMWSIQQL